MSLDPQFSSTIKNGAALIGSAETNLQVPVNATIVWTAGTSGGKIEEIVVHATTTTLAATTVAGLVYLFLFDGVTYHLFDTIPVVANTASATVAPFRASRTYQNLVLANGWSLRASHSIAGNASILKVEALAADF